MYEKTLLSILVAVAVWWFLSGRLNGEICIRIERKHRERISRPPEPEQVAEATVQVHTEDSPRGLFLDRDAK